MSSFKKVWESICIGCLGLGRMFVFVLYASLAMQLGAALNAVLFLGHSWTGLGMYHGQMVIVESSLLFWYCGLHAASLLWNCISGNVEAARKTVISLTNTGLVMGTLFWTFHILTGGKVYDESRSSGLQTNNTILAANTVIMVFCVRASWLLYRKHYGAAAKNVISILVITPITGAFAALSTTQPETVHEFMGKSAGG